MAMMCCGCTPDSPLNRRTYKDEKRGLKSQSKTQSFVDIYIQNLTALKKIYYIMKSCIVNKTVIKRNYQKKLQTIS